MNGLLVGGVNRLSSGQSGPKMPGLIFCGLSTFSPIFLWYLCKYGDPDLDLR